MSGTSGGATDGGSTSDSASGGALTDGAGPGTGGSGPGAGGTTNDGGATIDSGMTGTTVIGTVTINRATTNGRVGPGLATFSFEKSHMTDGFFTDTHASLIAMFKLLGPGVVRIGANDVDYSVWTPSAQPVQGGTTSSQVGSVDVDALAAFLSASGWKAIYGVAMKTSTPEAATAEATYVSNKLGASLSHIEIGNEINYYAGGIVTTQPRWETFADAIHAVLPDAPLAAPATAGDISFTDSFTVAEAQRMVLITHHYYRGAASSNPPLSQLLAADPTVTNQSQQLAADASSNVIRDGFRWGEMNSYSGHGAAGVSDVFGSALWAIDFMLTTAQYGAAGVHFHGGGQNQDGNVCTNGVSSCTKPFLYSPLIEVNSRVVAAAPLYYGMLLVSQVGVGNMLPTSVSAGSLNFTAYTIAPTDGSTNVVLVNKDATNGVAVSVDVGTAVGAANVVFLQAPSLTSKTGVTFAGAEVTSTGEWSPQPAFALPVSGNVVSVVVPPATAALVRAK